MTSVSMKSGTISAKSYLKCHFQRGTLLYRKTEGLIEEHPRSDSEKIDRRAGTDLRY